MRNFPASNKALIIAAAEKLLSDGRPTPQARGIYGAVQAAGIEIRAKERAIYISGILSKLKDKFKPDPKKGWSLKRKHQKVETGDVGASSGL